MLKNWIQTRRITFAATIVFYGIWAILKITNLDDFQGGNNSVLSKVSLAATLCGIGTTIFFSFCNHKIKKLKQQDL